MKKLLLFLICLTSLNSLAQVFKYEDESKLIVKVVDNKKEGTYKRYYKTGELLEKGTYKNGELDGPFKTYYETGEIKEKGNYKDDEKDGKSFIYKKDGTIKKIITYIFGEIRYEK